MEYLTENSYGLLGILSTTYHIFVFLLKESLFPNGEVISMAGSHFEMK